VAGKLRGWLWRLLGGATDEHGRPSAAADDLVVVFEGDPRDARQLQLALDEAGVRVAPEVHVPARFFGVSEPPRATISVRVADLPTATEVIEAHPHLGNSAAEVGDLAFRPRGFLSVAQFTSPAHADLAEVTLSAAGIRAVVTPPESTAFGGVGYVVSVRSEQLPTASQHLRALAERLGPEEFAPRDLWTG
jgi:hypothetical protein